MGAGIAQVAAGEGHRVVLYDASDAAIKKAEIGLNALMEKLVRKGKLTQSQADQLLGNIQFRENISSLSGADLVIEAIVEDLEIKKTVFATLEEIVSEDCILATNTSSLPVTSIAANCRKPERVVGIHFFNPPALMKLVEIVPAVQTSAQVVESARSLISSWGKTAVVAKDTPGFIVNRVARPFYSEAIRILEEGIADVPTIDQAVKEHGGFRMGPFELMDYIGNDVNYAVTESVWRSCYYEPRYKPSFTQKSLVSAGYLGRKSGRGYYVYGEGAENAQPANNPDLTQRVFFRILVMLINEAADALYLGVADRDGIDLAMTKGVNYPKGLLKWADEIGISHVEQALDELYHHYHEERYRCSPILRNKSKSKSTFYTNNNQDDKRG